MSPTVASKRSSRRSEGRPQKSAPMDQRGDDGMHAVSLKLDDIRGHAIQAMHVLRKEFEKSRFSSWHGVALALMLVVVVIGGTALTVIDHTTLKPGPAFPPLARSIAYVTNIPVKAGFLHFGFYALELVMGDYDAFSLHTGQRVTTLWYQYLQHHRWGQHLHMQVETLLQVLDLVTLGAIVVERRRGTRSSATSGAVESSKRQQLRRGYRERPVAQAFLAIVVLLMVIQNLITSSAYHTLAEQLVGYVLCCFKLAWDYTEAGSCFNSAVGKPMASASNLLLSCVAVVVLIGLDGAGVMTSSPPLVSVVIVAGAAANSKWALVPSSVDGWVRDRLDWLLRLVDQTKLARA